MKRLSTVILVFTIALAFFIFAPAFLNQPFSPNPHLKIADLLDLFTPLVVIPLYYLLLYYGGNQQPGLRSTIVLADRCMPWPSTHREAKTRNTIVLRNPGC